MITFPPAQEAYLAKIQGAPFQALLIRLQMDAITMRSTDCDGNITITGAGDVAGTYTPSRAVARISTTRGGSTQTGTLRMPDEDLSFSALIETEGWAEKPIQVYVVSGGAGTYTADETRRIFKGYTNDYDDQINAILLSLVETNSIDGWTGRTTVDEVFRHAPPVGQVVFWNNTYWTIERGPV